MLFNPLDYTTVFLSYDEPNCEENYRHLLSLNPQALRVHGVKGSDTAHKEVAKLSKTDSVIVVDADNFVKPSFYSTTIDVPNVSDLKTKVLSFSAYNTINGNSYGNGGIKVWPVSLLNSMRTHENGSGVDFDLSNYIELDHIASEIHFASGYQAWRAGFREGIKLLLEDNEAVGLNHIDYRNFERLWLWCHVGKDTEYGEFAINGARLGLAHMVTEYDFNRIIDFDNLLPIFNGVKMDSYTLCQMIQSLEHNWFFGDVLSEEDSKRYREHHIPPYRTFDNLDDEFMAWSHYFRMGAKLNNENELNKICTIGRSQLYGTYRIDGAIMGREYRQQNKHDSEMLGKIFDYSWLKEKYDRLYTNTI